MDFIKVKGYIKAFKKIKIKSCLKLYSYEELL